MTAGEFLAVFIIISLYVSTLVCAYKIGAILERISQNHKGDNHE